MYCECVGLSLTYRLKMTGKSDHPVLPQPAHQDGMELTSRKTFRTSEPEGVMRWFGPGGTGDL